MEHAPLLLVVEDDSAILSFLTAVLGANGYEVRVAASGQEALSLSSSYVPDAILLDLGLPDIDGLHVLRQIRIWSDIPVLVVSARGHEREKVEALDAGADDYITKPFGTGELLARIRAALRRHASKVGDSSAKTSIRVGDLFIDYEKRAVSLSGKEVHLTPIEYKIIVLLSENIGKVITHDTIVKHLWGPYAKDLPALRVNMANIRRKIEENPAEPRYIRTEVGVGYKMAEEADR